jgi:hypothetical protein
VNYDGKTFKAVSNSENGEIGQEMLFHYRQAGNVLSCEYSGGEIVLGHLVGLVDNEGVIDMRYHHINTSGDLRTGTCRSQPQIMSNGKMRLLESWQWTSGDQSAGSSILEEI